MNKGIQYKVKRAATRSWLAIAGLWGVGLLPCPDCGAPMLLHFWPLALALTLVHLRRGRHSADFTRSPGDTPAQKPETGNLETR